MIRGRFVEGFGIWDMRLVIGAGAGTGAGAGDGGDRK